MNRRIAILAVGGYERSELARARNLVRPGDWLVEVVRDGQFAGRRAVTVRTREEVEVRIDGSL